MKSINEIKNFDGKKVLVRVDWNVPLDKEGQVSDYSRIEASLETIEYIKMHGGLPIIASHFGREGESLQLVIDFAKNKYEILKEGVEFLENLRANSGEEANSEVFAREIANGADIYVNEAFSASHRSHASIVLVPKILPCYAGLHFSREVEALSRAFNPEHPFLFIQGGAKLETKLPLLEKFLSIADFIFVGGTLAAEAVNMALSQNPKIFFPKGDIRSLDVNEETLIAIKEKVERSKFILWNGPLGSYEKGYDWGTKELAKILARSFEDGATVIVGGGDTIVAIKELNLQDKFTHLSLAGGAMLEFLANGTLPGIEALKK